MSGGLPRSRSGVPGGWYVLAAVALIVAGGQTANSAVFGWHAAIPLPVSDAWYFIEGFVAKALTGELGLGDFFAQRSAGDHAQPFQKLVLLAHLRAADLDFRVEAMVGLAGAMLSAGLLSCLLVRNARDRAGRVKAAITAAGVWTVLFSTNATDLHTWSLVTLGWWMVASAVAFWWLAAVVRSPRVAVGLGLLGGGLIGLTWDEVAIPVAIAAVAASLLVDRRDGLARTVALAIGTLLGVGMARLALAHVAGDASAEATGGTLAGLRGLFTHPDAWHALTGPLADSVVHRSHLDAWTGPAAPAWQIAIAMVLGVAHVGFWWRVLVSRNLPAQQVAITAVAMMLFFYACVAGVLLSRGIDFGPMYVHQPRYVLVYQLNLVALALMFLGPAGQARAAQRVRLSPAGLAAAAGLIAVIAVQLPLARAAWMHAPYLRNYVERSALTMGQLATDPTAVPAGGCSQILTICSAPVQSRRNVMRILAGHRLNVFSPAFQARHRLYPDAQAAAFAAGAPECDATVLDWGPRQIVRGQGFNVQADGRSAFWVRLAPGARVERLAESGKEVEFVRGDGALSFQVDQVLAAKIAAREQLQFEASCPQGGSARFNVPIVAPIAGR